MRNRVGMILFVSGFIGECLAIMALDDPRAWLGAIVCMVIFGLLGTVGYLLMDVEEVIEGTGYKKIKESKETLVRKARNREQVWQTWLATTKNTL